MYDAHVDDAVEDGQGREVHHLLALQQLEGGLQQLGQLQEDGELGVDQNSLLKLVVASLVNKVIKQLVQSTVKLRKGNDFFTFKSLTFFTTIDIDLKHYLVVRRDPID